MNTPALTSALIPILTSAIAAFALSGCIYIGEGNTAAAGVSSRPEQQVPSVQVPEERVLNFANWPDYMPEGLLEAFERESGIKVNYRTFKSNEELMKSLDPVSSDDLVVPSSNFAGVQIDMRLLRPLDKSALTRLGNVDPAVNEALATSDPGNRFLVPWSWGYTTVGINATKVAAVLGSTPLPANSWELLFNPVYANKLKQCGIGYLDSPTEVIPVALHYLGKPLDSMDPSSEQAVSKLLTAVRPTIKKFSSTLIDDLASGNVCAVLGWSGDISAAKVKAAEKGSKDVFEVLMPSTGAIVWFDTLAIPSTAKHPKNAHAFIDFFLRPDVAATMSTRLNYPSANRAAMVQIPTAIRSNTVMYPPTDDMARMTPQPKLGNVTRAAMIQTYIAFAYGLGKSSN